MTDEQSWAWGEEDMLLLRQFLATDTGKRLLEALRETEPELLSGECVNSALVRMGEVRNHKAAIRFIKFLANPPKQPEQKRLSAYPDLDDDSAWDANNKPIEA